MQPTDYVTVFKTLLAFMQQQSHQRQLFGHDSAGDRVTIANIAVNDPDQSVLGSGPKVELCRVG